MHQRYYRERDFQLRMHQKLNSLSDLRRDSEGTQMEGEKRSDERGTGRGRSKRGSGKGRKVK